MDDNGTENNFKYIHASGGNTLDGAKLACTITLEGQKPYFVM